jgi:competence protein ComEC
MTPLVRFGLAWMAGIALARWFNPPWFVVALATLPVMGAFLLYRQNVRTRSGAILILSLLAGVLHLQFSQPAIAEDHVAFYNDSARVKVTGVVVDEPDIRDFHINLRLRTESIQINGSSRPIDGLVLVRAPRYPERFYGDRLTVSGQLETPPVFEDFSYKNN